MKSSQFLLRGFRRPREIACFALGKLERQVMEETWRLGEVTVLRTKVRRRERADRQSPDGSQRPPPG